MGEYGDERVAWRSLDKPHQAGVVTFHRLDDSRTRVTLQMEYDPEGFLETAGDWLQVVRLRVVNDIERFKWFIESRGSETGGWRGDVPGPHQRGSTYDDGAQPAPPGPGGRDDRVPPGTVGGEDRTPGTTLPPPGPVPPGRVPPQSPGTPGTPGGGPPEGPRPML